jgi:hypothetical protein
MPQARLKAIKAFIRLKLIFVPSNPPAFLPRNQSSQESQGPMTNRTTSHQMTFLKSVQEIKS